MVSPSLFQCLHSTHTVATIIDIQTVFSKQILSVGVGLNSVCYSIPLYTIKSSVAVDLNFEPQKLKYCNIKGLWMFIYKKSRTSGLENVSQKKKNRLLDFLLFGPIYQNLLRAEKYIFCI
jgi:hypothetical protein